MNLATREYRPADAIGILTARAKQPGAELDEMAEQLAGRKEQEGPSATVVAKGRVISCGGLSVVWPGMAEGWCLFVDDIASYPMLPRTAKRILRQWIDKYKLVRVQAPLRADFPEGLRFANWLGFEAEGRLRNYHPDGCDAIMHSLIIER